MADIILFPQNQETYIFSYLNEEYALIRNQNKDTFENRYGKPKYKPNGKIEITPIDEEKAVELFENTNDIFFVQAEEEGSRGELSIWDCVLIAYFEWKGRLYAAYSAEEEEDEVPLFFFRIEEKDIAPIEDEAEGNEVADYFERHYIYQ